MLSLLSALIFESCADGTLHEVERLLGFEDHNPTNFTWTRLKPDEIEYFRMAYVNVGRLDVDAVFEYTKPATWFTNGTWRHFGT